MAYQHLFGRAAGGSSGAGYKTLAVTEEFYNIMSDDELSNVNNYTFTAGEEHPVKFCSYYREYKQCFIQSAISFEYDYVGRNSSVAHTLVLTETESRRLLEEHICPLNMKMFMNAGREDFARPSGSSLPAVNYHFEECGDREYNTGFITKFFNSNTFAEFILALLLSAENNYSVFVKLPGTFREASFNAVRLMNIILPGLPAEYKKKLGFMTYVTDTYTYEDISVYFVSGMDLSKQFINGAYIFDLSKEKPFVSGIDPTALKEYYDLIRAIFSNILSYDEPSLNEYYNAILPKTDGYSRFDLQKVNEIYFMWKFLSGSSEEDVDDSIVCSIISSFYDFYDIVDNKVAFMNRINGYWEREIEKCKAGGYAPGIDIFNVIDSRYPTFGDDEKRQAQRIWSFIVIYTMSNHDDSIYSKIFSTEYQNSELAADIFRYIARIYVGFLYRKDSNTQMAAAYDSIIGGCAKTAADAPDSILLFIVLGNLIVESDAFYDEMAIDKNSQYSLFSPILKYFEQPVTARFNDAGLQRKFRLLADLKTYTHAEESSLGRTVYDHFKSGSFMPGVHTAFNNINILRMADNRKVVTDLANALEEFPELESISTIALFRRFSNIINTRPSLAILYELNELVNKPDDQDMLREWVGVYSRKAPDLMLSLLANTRCKMSEGGGIAYRTDYKKAYSDYFDAAGNDNEQMMRDINRFIGEAETAAPRPEYKDLGLASFREPTVEFINERFFDKSIDRRILKENEAMLKRYDKIRNIRISAAADAKEQKRQHKLFGKK